MLTRYIVSSTGFHCTTWARSMLLRSRHPRCLDPTVLSLTSDLGNHLFSDIVLPFAPLHLWIGGDAVVQDNHREIQGSNTAAFGSA